MQQGGLRVSGKVIDEPLVSIICVTFNAEKILPQLIENIRAGKTEDIEFVVVDGQSQDNTVKILVENSDIINYWVSEPDQGIYDAMNKAVTLVTGKWVIFLGADDKLMDEFGNALAALKNPETIYYGNVLFYGKPFSKVYYDYYLTKLNICHQAIFYPRAVFKKYKYDLKYKVYADYHLNLRCWNDPQFKFEHIDYLIASFPDGGFSSYTKDVLFDGDRDMLFKKYLKRKSYYRYLNRSLGFWKMLGRILLNK
jgi:glycosyltransferase involved in cell wall biosynthesis